MAGGAVSRLTPVRVAKPKAKATAQKSVVRAALPTSAP